MRRQRLAEAAQREARPLNTTEKPNTNSSVPSMTRPRGGSGAATTAAAVVVVATAPAPAPEPPPGPDGGGSPLLVLSGLTAVPDMPVR